MPPKSEAETHIRVRVTCPHCKTSGRVDASRLGSSFRCGSCQQSFYVDVQQTRKGVREKEKVQDPGKIKFDVDKPSRVGQMWGAVPRAAKMAALAAVGLYAVWHFAGDLIVPGAPLPEGLEERATLAVQALIERDTATVRRLANPTSNSVDCSEWVKRARPVTWPKGFTAGRTPPMRTMVTSNARQKNPQKSGIQATASVVVTVEVPEAATEPKKEFITYWTQSADEFAWKMDVKRTNTSIPTMRK